MCNWLTLTLLLSTKLTTLLRLEAAEIFFDQLFGKRFDLRLYATYI